MDLSVSHDFPNSPVCSNENDDPLPSQSPHTANISHFNPQTPLPPSSNSFLNYSNQITAPNQFQINYGFHPNNFTPHVGQQFSFQNMWNAPHISVDSHISTSSKRNCKKQKTTPNNQNKDFEESQTHRRNWSKEEDVALTKAYLHISIDPIVGTDQQSDRLWQRIHIAWKDFLVNDFVDDRPINGLSKRWCTIQGAVNKFHGIFELLRRSIGSGKSFEDLKRDAHKSYKATSAGNKPFLFEHCWMICKKNVKWCTQQLGTNTSKQQNTSGVNPTHSNPSISTTPSAVQNDIESIDVDVLVTETIDGDVIARPPGRQISKEKKKMQLQDKGVVDVLSKLQVSLQQQFDHNEKELELKRETTKKELEIKERELALKEKAQRRKDQQKLLNQDLSKLSPMVSATLEKLQQKILKEWEEEDYY